MSARKYINEQAVKRGLHEVGKCHSVELVARLNAAVQKLIKGIGNSKRKRVQFLTQGVMVGIVESDGAVIINV